MGDATSYQRGSRVALTELAPGSTFYAQGLAAKIDAVDLGAGESNIHTWRLCPQCGWAGITHAGEEAPTLTRSEEHTSELQSLMLISYAVFCLKTKKQHY